MQKTFLASTRRSTRRSVIWRSAIVSCAALVSAAGCQTEPLGPPAADGAASGRGNHTVAGSGGLTGTTGGRSGGGSAGTTGGSLTTGAGSGSGGAFTGGSAGSGAFTGGGAGSGGTLAGGGGAGNAGAFTGGSAGSGGAAAGIGGMSFGGMGGAAKPCVDVQPPPDPEWPGAVCENWATETTACSESWFAQYCDVSCGRCVPEGGAAGAPGVDCSTAGLPAVNGGNGYATRYWDCCQTHCSQFDGHRCGQDGTSNTGNTQSACNGGGSFACYDQAPHAVTDCLSYGYIAKSNPNCGGCYRIQFTGEGQYNANDPGSKLLKGRQMIVKVSNTGGDVAGNQFDMMIPGGGVGQFNACSRQWGTSDLGAQYGGFLTECTGAHSAKKECVRQECMKIPAGSARDGCLWFVDWFQVADNPKFTSQSTDCPF